MSKGHAGQWSCYIRIYGESADDFEDYMNHAESAQLAICLAALKAIEVTR
jgi:hypothetical protein